MKLGDGSKTNWYTEMKIPENEVLVGFKVVSWPNVKTEPFVSAELCIMGLSPITVKQHLSTR